MSLLEGWAALIRSISLCLTLSALFCSDGAWERPPLKVPQGAHYTWHKAARNAEGGCLSGLFSVSNNCWRVTESLNLTSRRSSEGDWFSWCLDLLQYPRSAGKPSEPHICSVTTPSSQGSSLGVVTERSHFGIQARPCLHCVTLS